MEGSLDSQVNIHLQDKTSSEVQATKKGKLLCKTVVTVKIEAGGRKHKNEGPPSDSWSWRKYGQKPIKGSPYPRGYYRCSMSKGCPAKKQVERCRTDASRLLITYTCTHNHPGPSTMSPKSKIQKLTMVSSDAHFGEPALQQSEQGEQEQTSMDIKDISTNLGKHFHYLEPLHDVTSQIDYNPFSLELDNTQEPHDVLFDEVPTSFYPMQTCPKPESEEYDFFDELEELPLESLPFRSIMTSRFYDDMILVQPS